MTRKRLFFPVFPSFSAKISETPSTFRVAALLQIAKTFTMKEGFLISAFPSVRLAENANRKTVESKGDAVERVARGRPNRR